MNGTNLKGLNENSYPLWASILSLTLNPIHIIIVAKWIEVPNNLYPIATGNILVNKNSKGWQYSEQKEIGYLNSWWI